MARRSTVALVVALCAAAALVVSSGAFAWDADGPVDVLTPGVENQVEMQPSSQYAYLDDSGETVIDISPSNPNMEAEGVNPDAVTTIRNVSLLRYVGSGNATVWVTHNATGLSIEADGEPIEARGSAITLEAQEAIGLDLIVNTTGTDSISGDLTLEIHAEVPEADADSGTGFATAQLEEEPTIRVLEPAPDERDVQIRNLEDGSSIGTDTIDLKLDASGSVVSGLTVTAGQAGDVDLTITSPSSSPPTTVATDRPLTTIKRFDVRQDGPFEFDRVTIDGKISAAGAPTGTVLEEIFVLRQTGSDWEPVQSTTRVRNDSAAFHIEDTRTGTYVIAAPVPDIAVTAASLNETNVTVGESVTVEAQVENGGTATANETVTIQVGNETVGTVPVELDPGETMTLVDTVELTTPGNVTVAVGGETAGTVTVMADTTPEPTSENETEPQPVAQDEGNRTTTERPDPDQGTPDDDDGLVEEPAAIALGRLGGLIVFAALGVALVMLIRRVPV